MNKYISEELFRWIENIDQDKISDRKYLEKTVCGIRSLIENGADVNHRTIQGNDIVMRTILSGRDSFHVIRELLDSNYDLTHKNKNKQNALHIACDIDPEEETSDRVDTIRLLIKYGINTNDKDTSGDTPLDLVLYHDLKKIKEILFPKRHKLVSPFYKDQKIYSMYEFLIKNSDSESSIDLWELTNKHNPNVIKNYNSTSIPLLALINIFKKNGSMMMNILLDSGANLSIPYFPFDKGYKGCINMMFFTAVPRKNIQQYVKVLERIVKLHPKIIKMINLSDAIRSHQPKEIIKFFLDHGVSVTSKEIRTAIDRVLEPIPDNPLYIIDHYPQDRIKILEMILSRSNENDIPDITSLPYKNIPNEVIAMLKKYKASNAWRSSGVSRLLNDRFPGLAGEVSKFLFFSQKKTKLKSKKKISRRKKK